MVRGHQMLIGGKAISSKEKLEVFNPFTGEKIAAVARATEGDIDKAIESARQAFEVTRRMAPYQRVEILENVVKGLREYSTELADTIVAESGKPIRFAKGEVARAINTFTIAAEEAKRIGGEVISMDLLETAKNRFGYSRRYPIGVIGGISPFNFPLNLVCHKVAPCLASGNTMVLKPASYTPLTALKLGEIVMEAGASPGTLNVVPCPGRVGEGLATDERVAKITFTGSDEVGWHLKHIAGKKKVTLELGGNAGAIVHSDAGLDFAAKRLALGSYAYAGQVCIAVQRIFVEASAFDDFRDRFVEETRNTKVGDPAEPETIVGPMIDEAAAERAQRWLQEAIEQGAEILFGGNRDRAVLHPTVLTKTKPEMKVRSEEVFAPIVTLEPYGTFDEAVNLVNDSRFGLQAAVFTQDIRRIMRAHNELVVGGVIVNDYPTFRIDHMPYGGVKDSGLGREGVKYAIEDMTEPRLLVINLP